MSFMKFRSNFSISFRGKSSVDHIVSEGTNNEVSPTFIPGQSSTPARTSEDDITRPQSMLLLNWQGRRLAAGLCGEIFIIRRHFRKSAA